MGAIQLVAGIKLHNAYQNRERLMKTFYLTDANYAIKSHKPWLRRGQFKGINFPFYNSTSKQKIHSAFQKPYIKKNNNQEEQANIVSFTIY